MNGGESDRMFSAHSEMQQPQIAHKQSSGGTNMAGSNRDENEDDSFVRLNLLEK